MIMERVSKLNDKFSRIEGQFVFTDTGVAVQKVVTADGTKDQLYDKVLEFLARTYKDSKEVIQVKEKDSGLIIGKGLYSFYIDDLVYYGTAVKNNIYHIIKTECKEGRVRVTITVDSVEEYRPPTKAIGSYPAQPASTTTEEILKLYDEYKAYVEASSSDIGSISEIDAPAYGGYQVYYTIKDMLWILDAMEESLNKKSVLDTGDDW
jgi:hypothetical protein